MTFIKEKEHSIKKLYLLILLVVSFDIMVIISMYLLDKKIQLLGWTFSGLISIAVLIFLFKVHKLFFKFASYMIPIANILVSLIYIWKEFRFLSVFISVPELNYLYLLLTIIFPFAILFANILFLVCLSKSSIKLYYLVGILGVISIISGVFLIAFFPTQDKLLDCSKLSGYVARDNCFLGLVVSWEKPHYCERIITPSTYNICAGVSTKNTSYCYMMDNQTQTDICLTFVTKDESYCTNLPEEMKSICLNFIKDYEQFASIYKK